MPYTRYITFNDITANVSFPTKLSSNNHLDWTLTLTSGTNKVSTNGSVTMEVPASKATPAPAPTVTTTVVTSWPTTSTISSDDKSKHIAFIKEGLETIETTPGRDAKAIGAKMLYDYMLMCALDFVKGYELYKVTVINKAYELKKDAPDKTAMITSLNKLLTALNVPLVPPVTTVPSATPTKVEPPKSSNTVVTPAKDDTAEYNLFVTMAKNLECESVCKSPKNYYGYYQTVVKRGGLRGSTVAEKMENYFTSWGGGSKKLERSKLMKSIFTKNNLTYNEAVMAMYDEWLKTYKPTTDRIPNRYMKMIAFIDANKSLFSSA
jgi:hypothetical protein